MRGTCYSQSKTSRKYTAHFHENGKTLCGVILGVGSGMKSDIGFAKHTWCETCLREMRKKT